jgi:hypothetical protein
MPHLFCVLIPKHEFFEYLKRRTMRMINMLKKSRTHIIAAGLISILMILLPMLGIARPPVVPPTPLPLLNIPAPPFVVLIPGIYVYFVPDVAVDLLFYHGYWYRPLADRWYRGTHYNGPWVGISRHRVPPALLNLPHDYHRLHPGYERIPHGKLMKHWRAWERERHGERRR